MRRTAIYMRVSTDKQVREGDSLSAQREALMSYVKAHNDLVLVGEYVDDGVSGTRLDRDELQRLLDDVEQGKIDLILVVKLDRWFRSIRHYINTQELLDKYHVGWIAIWEPIYDSTTPQGRLIINQMMSIAQFEAEQTGQRIRQVFAYKKERGEWLSGNYPYGFSIIDKHIVPNEDAEIARKIFETYAMTGNLRETARKARTYGYPYDLVSVRRMLRKDVYRDYGVITDELYEDVRRKMPMNIKVSQKRVYLFSGLLTCSECGARMSSCRKGESLRYRCPKHYDRTGNKCKNSKDIGERQLERYLLDNLSNMLSGYVIQQEEQEGRVQNSEGRIKALRRKIDRLKELYVDEMIGMEEYKEDRDAFLAEIASLQKSASPSLKAHKAILEMNMNDTYSGFTQTEKRTFWRGIIREIRFDSNKKVTVIFL